MKAIKEKCLLGKCGYYSENGEGQGVCNNPYPCKNIEVEKSSSWELWKCGSKLFKTHWSLNLNINGESMLLRVTEEEAELIQEKFEGLEIVELPF